MQPSLAVVYAAWLGLIALMAGLTLLWKRWRARFTPADTVRTADNGGHQLSAIKDQ